MAQAHGDDRWRASVVIPAHNEATVIGRCLSALTATPLSAALQVVVVANGCSDDTADVARRFLDRLPGLTVMEREAAGKTGALNAGDQACEALPRIFLDADIELLGTALDAMVSALRRDGAWVACPSVRFDVSASSWPVAAFYRIYTHVPYVSRGLVGLGVYGVSRDGRARFDSFPELTNDDLYIQRLFLDGEVLSVPGTFMVRAPRNWSDLVAVRTRVARGNAQLAASGRTEVDASSTTRATLTSILGIVARRPWLAPHAVVFVAAALRARAAARRSGAEVWQRDSSSRVR